MGSGRVQPEPTRRPPVRHCLIVLFGSASARRWSFLAERPSKIYNHGVIHMVEMINMFMGGVVVFGFALGIIATINEVR